ncbi:MAG TPA: RNA 3'-terminal phosphate cyclase [Planctomycetota bacterium]|nr:RNA 3'-terminal phosphate cyclase [Planctomycetota bacterium]
MLHLDGSAGEGGGQILRTALGLSLVTGTPFTIEKIRAGRENPGLLRQHLTAVRAAATIGEAEVSGAAIGSQILTFKPGAVRAGDFAFTVGTAGSATLVLQTVLPALLVASAPSRLSLEGGTHNPWAPPFDFVEKAFLPLLARMGARVTTALSRRGFFPAGGGTFTAAIEPSGKMARLDLTERGGVRAARATAIVAALPPEIGRRELAVLGRRLNLDGAGLRLVEDRESAGPGNAVMVEVESEHVLELFTGFGEKRMSAEAVAERVADQVRGYLAANVPVGEYLADQLLIPLALARGGSFLTGALSAHTTTNMEVIRKFLDVIFEVDRTGEGAHRVAIG